MRTGRRDEWGARFACWVWWFEFRFFVVAFLCVCGVWFVHIAVHSFLGFRGGRVGLGVPDVTAVLAYFIFKSESSTARAKSHYYTCTFGVCGLVACRMFHLSQNEVPPVMELNTGGNGLCQQCDWVILIHSHRVINCE